MSEREAFYFCSVLLAIFAVVYAAGFFHGDLMYLFLPIWEDLPNFFLVPLIVVMLYTARRRRRNVAWNPFERIKI